MSTFVRFRDANLTNEEGAGKILAKIIGQSVVVGAETSLRVEEKGGGADDTVDVQVGEVVILDDDGFALGGWSDAIENLPVTSNSSGDPRIDVVVAYVDKAVEDNALNNSPDGLVFDIVDGTPAGSPSPPNDATIQSAVGADNPFIKLAQIAVADSFVSIVDANITDIREQFSIQSGGKKFQYDVATNKWNLEDSLEVEGTVNAPGGINGGGILKSIQYFTADDTWNKPADLQFAVVEVIGAGGGGGGCATTGASQSAVGRGGAGGGYSREKIAAGSLGATETVTVGTGGAGGAAGNNDGSDGGTTSFGSLLQATGGGEGNGDAAASQTIPALLLRMGTSTAAGVGSGGDLNLDGNRGFIHEGGKAAGPYGGGPTPGGTQGDGSDGVEYGGGGTGGVNRDASTGTARSGGAGADGIVVVHEYF